CPTRELVVQVAKEIKSLGRFKSNLSVVPVYGGQPIEKQLRSLKKEAQIVVGTPGRTMDHLRRGSLKVDNLSVIVLDEADEMLDMGFREDIEVILRDTPSDRQTVMFSATMPKEIIKLSKVYLKNPIHIDVTDIVVNSPKIKQFYYEVKEQNKPELLIRLIDMNKVKLGLVFCNTKSQVDYLVEYLKEKNYFADGLHGDMSQNQRDKVMGSFRKGTVELLVATDIAGRGIDVDDIEAVFNYDLPRDDEDYTHRIGRTARAGKKGKAMTFVSTSGQIHHLKKIETANGTRIVQGEVPSISDLESSNINNTFDKINEYLSSEDLEAYMNHLEPFVNENNSPLKVAAAVLKMSLENSTSNYQDVDLNEQIEYVEKRENRSNRRNNRSNRPSKSSLYRKNSDRKYSDKKSSENKNGTRSSKRQNDNSKNNKKSGKNPFVAKFSSKNNNKRPRKKV
ncbi:MAG: DEAD/DEAH box helicase, partial [Vampirovibrionia bacterium]